jgi:8-oxo-dGTP pyrophosphatase MutT (NUDIX family)
MKVVLPGVRGLVVDGSGRLLLQKRADFSNWGLPAGVVDPGDSALEALRREVREETGITVLRALPFGLYSDPRYSVTYPNGDQVQTFTIAFLVRDWTGSPTADGVESIDARFFPLDELPSPIYPIHRECIEDYRSWDGTFVMK